MNRRLRNCLVAVSTSALLVACGGGEGNDDSDSAEATPYVDAISDAVVAGQFEMDEDESRCFGEDFVDIVGLEELESQGTPEEIGAEFEDFELLSLELSKEQGESAYDALGECGYDMREDLLESLFEGQEVDEETESCIEDAVAEDQLRDFVVVLMTEGSEVAQQSEPWQEIEGNLIACEPAPADS